MTRKSLGYVRLEWTCPNCSTRNPGPRTSCVNCGAPQPDNVKFERAAREQRVTDQESIHAAQAGADYICPYCGTRNSVQAKTCVQCGGDLAEAKRRASGAELEAAAGPEEVTCPNCGTLNRATNANCSKCGSPLPRASLAASSEPLSASSAVAAAKKRTNWLLLGGIGAALVVCAAVLILFVFPSSTLPATVAGVRWQTSVPVQELHAVSHSNEAGSPPSGAYDVSCHTESRQVCVEKVVDQGNGFGEKVQDCHDESQDYCSFKVDEWQMIRTYTLEGVDYSPVYSQPSLVSGQRLGTGSADLTVVFDTESGQKTYSASSLSDFEQFTVGSAWNLRLNAMGGILSVGR